jgi:hypothetical protein
LGAERSLALSGLFFGDPTVYGALEALKHIQDGDTGRDQPTYREKASGPRIKQ